MLLKTRVCDECGKPATWGISMSAGRVLIDGKDNKLRSCDLCEDHKPLEGSNQPTNCKRVVFWRPGDDLA